MFTLNEPKCPMCGGEVIRAISRSAHGKVLCSTACLRVLNKRLRESKYQTEFSLGGTDEHLLEEISQNLQTETVPEQHAMSEV